MNPYLLAALLLTTPAWAAPDTFDHRWPMKDQSRMVQTPVEERIYEADEHTPIDAMAPALVGKSMNKADVCAKVGKRKTMIGRYRWTCR